MEDNKLKKFRRWNGLSVKKMAELLEISDGTYFRWEANPETIPVGKAYQIATVFRESIDTIFLP